MGIKFILQIFSLTYYLKPMLCGKKYEAKFILPLPGVEISQNISRAIWSPRIEK